MHPNLAFRQTGTARSLAFVRERGFGVLALNGPEGPLLSHVPFLLDVAGDGAELHLVRSNPIARLDLPAAATIAVSGPDGYVSPDWYGVADQVPTWNYVAVHLIGRLEPSPPDALRPLLDRLSAAFESRLAPKPPWTSEKMSPGTMDRMMRAVLPFAFRIQRVESTWKLSQNKAPAVRLAASDGMAAHGIGAETGTLARLMREAD